MSSDRLLASNVSSALVVDMDPQLCSADEYNDCLKVVNERMVGVTTGYRLYHISGLHDMGVEYTISFLRDDAFRRYESVISHIDRKFKSYE